MFEKRKVKKILTVLVAIQMIGITFGITFLITGLVTESNLGIIMQNGVGYLIIRAIFFGVIVLGAFVFEKETQTRHAGVIGSMLAVVGFAVSIFTS